MQDPKGASDLHVNAMWYRASMAAVDLVLPNCAEPQQPPTPLPPAVPVARGTSIRWQDEIDHQHRAYAVWREAGTPHP